MPGWKGQPIGLECKSHSIWPEESHVKFRCNTTRHLFWLQLEQTYCSSLQKISLHCTRMHFTETSPSPHTPRKARGKVRVWLTKASLASHGHLSWETVVARSCKTHYPRLSFPGEGNHACHTSRLSGSSQGDGDNLWFWSSCCICVAINLI
jgi:hypothetical protein